MPDMIKIENDYITYNELLVIDSDAVNHTCDVIGIGDDGKLLFVKEREAHSGNAYYLQREFFQIDKDEYLNCLGTAANNLRLQKSISKGATDIEVLYKGRYFSAGSSVRYLIHHKECSVFTGDSALAEELGFERIDKFEYEKTLRINECDAVRITHKDAESEAVLVRREFGTTEFEYWLEMLQQSGAGKC